MGDLNIPSHYFLLMGVKKEILSKSLARISSISSVRILSATVLGAASPRLSDRKYELLELGFDFHSNFVFG